MTKNSYYGTQPIAAPSSDPYHLWLYSQMAVPPTEYDKILREQSSGLYLFQAYEDLDRDPQVFAALQSRVGELIRRELIVIPGVPDNRRSQKQADTIKEKLLSIGNFDDVVGQLMKGALLIGFSAAQSLWKKKGGELGLGSIEYRPQYRFGFALEDGQWAPRVFSNWDVTHGEPLPNGATFIFHFHERERSPYGLGLGHRLYWPVFLKRHGAKFWAILAERFAIPKTSFTYPEGMQQRDREKLLSDLNEAAGDAVFGVPAGVTLDIMGASVSQSGATTLEGFVEYWDNQISKVILGQTGTIDQDKSGGSRARDEVADRVTLRICKGDADSLSATLNSTIVQWLTKLYYGDSVIPPKIYWAFPELEERPDLDAMAARDKIIVEMSGLRLTREYLETTYGVEFEEEEPEEAEEATEPEPKPADTEEAEEETELSTAEIEPFPVRDRSVTGTEFSLEPRSASYAAFILEHIEDALIEAEEVELSVDPRANADSFIFDRIEESFDMTEVSADWETMLQDAIVAADDFDDLLETIPDLLGEFQGDFAQALELGILMTMLAGMAEVEVEAGVDGAEFSVENPALNEIIEFAKNCKKQACGNSCIAVGKRCHKAPPAGGGGAPAGGGGAPAKPKAAARKPKAANAAGPKLKPGAKAEAAKKTGARAGAAAKKEAAEKRRAEEKKKIEAKAKAEVEKRAKAKLEAQAKARAAAEEKRKALAEEKAKAKADAIKKKAEEKEAARKAKEEAKEKAREARLDAKVKAEAERYEARKLEAENKARDQYNQIRAKAIENKDKWVPPELTDERAIGAGISGVAMRTKAGTVVKQVLPRSVDGIGKEEVSLQKKVAELGLAPKVIGSSRKTIEMEDATKNHVPAYVIESPGQYKSESKFKGGRQATERDLEGIADAFQQIHSKNITHRDAHSGNVFLPKKDGDPIRFIDFGRARQKYEDIEDLANSLENDVSAFKNHAVHIARANKKTINSFYPDRIKNMPLYRLAFATDGDTSDFVRYRTEIGADDISYGI